MIVPQLRLALALPGSYGSTLLLLLLLLLPLAGRLLLLLLLLSLAQLQRMLALQVTRALWGEQRYLNALKHA